MLASMRETRTLILIGGGNVNWCPHFGTISGSSRKLNLELLKKKKLELLFDPAIPCLGTYQEN